MEEKGFTTKDMDIKQIFERERKILEEVHSYKNDTHTNYNLNLNK